jgi:hypothetical protein
MPLPTTTTRNGSPFDELLYGSPFEELLYGSPFEELL